MLKACKLARESKATKASRPGAIGCSRRRIESIEQSRQFESELATLQQGPSMYTHIPARHPKSLSFSARSSDRVSSTEYYIYY
ncbi:hypothetical protein GOP47_0003613 [Adiantum capillus-veneris]|uniref:Uncharacterized protein n=1 Tax=Adiantum capillus-veneris TaxID=13818 RepID=A0A9D4V5Y7_ADICA|nr:hypothetical protein GOP47_0003613 [Adiantum capillus-veneris]